jgi:hypothetical protein
MSPTAAGRGALRAETGGSGHPSVHPRRPSFGQMTKGRRGVSQSLRAHPRVVARSPCASRAAIATPDSSPPGAASAALEWARAAAAGSGRPHSRSCRRCSVAPCPAACPLEGQVSRTDSPNSGIRPIFPAVDTQKLKPFHASPTLMADARRPECPECGAAMVPSFRGFRCPRLGSCGRGGVEEKVPRARA